MVNKAILVGRVGQEPKVFDGAKGKVVAISVATDTGFGENKGTLWENVKVFGKLADVVAEHVHKGTLVYVEGRREESGTDGKKYINVIANEIKFLSRPSEDRAEGPSPKPIKSAGRARAADSDDIPL